MRYTISTSNMFHSFFSPCDPGFYIHFRNSRFHWITYRQTIRIDCLFHCFGNGSLLNNSPIGETNAIFCKYYYRKIYIILCRPLLTTIKFQQRQTRSKKSIKYLMKFKMRFHFFCVIMFSFIVSTFLCTQINSSEPIKWHYFGLSSF